MANKSLTFDIFGKDKTASKTMKKVGGNATALGKTFGKVGKGMAAGLGLGALGVAAVGAAITRFGVDSVKAFATAEKSENNLRFALEKFPKTADTNIKALKKLNTEIMKKTRFDDDALASGEAILAQYKLTGEQMMDIMPLVADYAAKTGRDIPAASKIVGKALMGQGRALKDVGIDFEDTGTVAGNFDSLMGDLSTSVGGFAEGELSTANGKLENMRNRFGEVQEKVGEALMPILEDLMLFVEDTMLPGLEDFATWFQEEGSPAIQDIVDWVTKWKDILGPAATAIGVLTAAQWLLNIAMAANPVGAVIAVLMLMVAAVVLVITHWDELTMGVQVGMNFLKRSAESILTGIAIVAQGLVNNVLFMIRSIIGPVNDVLRAMNLPVVSLPSSVNFVGAVQKAAKGGGQNSGGGTPAKAMAAGGVVKARPGGIFANIGEGRHDEAVIPLTNSVLSKMGGGGMTVVINVPGGTVTSENQLAKTVERALSRAQSRGSISSRTVNV